MSITRDSLVYLDDFLPLELEDARRGIGDSDLGAEDRFLFDDDAEEEVAVGVVDVVVDDVVAEAAVVEVW